MTAPMPPDATQRIWDQHLKQTEGNPTMPESYTLHPATVHALGCGMNNGWPVIACVCGLPNKQIQCPVIHTEQNLEPSNDADSEHSALQRPSTK